MLLSDGKHHDAVLCATRKTVPPAASASRFGVAGAGIGVPVCTLRHSPALPYAHSPWSSEIVSTTFGRGTLVGTHVLPPTAHTPDCGHGAPPGHTPSSVGQHGDAPDA